MTTILVSVNRVASIMACRENFTILAWLWDFLQTKNLFQQFGRYKPNN